MNPLLLDYETRGYLNLPSVGAYEYLKSAEILFVGLTSQYLDGPVISDRVGDIDGELTPVSWGRFDYLVYNELEAPFPSERWVDAQALALYLGFPAGLNAFCSAVGFENKKDPRGTRLINKYCSPDETGEFPSIPDEDWQAFQEYCIQDVRLLERAWSALEPFYEDWESQWRDNYETVACMNENGVPIDRDAAIVARRRAEQYQEELREECHRLVGYKPTQTEKIRVFLGLPNVTKDTLEGVTFDDPAKERVRQIRLLTSKAAGKKLAPMISMSASDGRARGCFVSNGAHTGRGTSRDIQFQNMKRRKVDEDYFDQMDTWPDPIAGAQENIRGFVRASDGCSFVVADYAQIEARILAWVANDRTLIEAFRDPSRDIYCEFAEEFYMRPVVKGDDERQLGKLGVLATGYGVSGKGIQRQAPSYGVTLDDKAGRKIVALYNDSFPAVSKFRDAAIKAAKRCLRSPGYRERVGVVEFFRSGSFLVLVLPSARELRYFKPSLSEDHDGFDFSRRLGASMVRTRMWHGALTENIVQAIAADIKLDAMKRLEDVYKAKLILEVHDEIVAECPDFEAETLLKAMLGVMSSPPDYVPSGLLGAEGAIVKRYTKV